MVDRPSEKLRALLSGEVHPADADPSILSWAQLEVHLEARRILGLKGKDERRHALGRLPNAIRPLVEERALVLHWRDLDDRKARRP